MRPLVSRTSSAVDQDAMLDLLRGSPLEAYQTFIRDHAGFWMPAFAREVIQCSEVPFFRLAAQLLESFVNCSKVSDIGVE